MRKVLFVLFALATQVACGQVNSKELKPRLVVLTDIGPADIEPDDNESAVRLMAYADRFEIEAICTSTGWNCDPYPEASTEYLFRVIDAYGKDVQSLMKRSGQKGFLSLKKENGKQRLGYWPSVEYIRSRAMMGSKRAGIGVIGEGNDSPGSEMLIRLADEDDPRPIWVTAWGGANTLAQAIWRVKQTRSTEELKRFVRKFRLYTITDQDMQWAKRRNHAFSSHQWLRREFKDDLMLIWDESAWLNQNALGVENWEKYAQLIQHHGNLGEVYPKYKYGVEGDTPSFLHLMPNGLNYPEDPTQVGWGGYHVYALSPDSITYAWTNWQQPVKTISDSYEKRFYDDEFNDFAARMAWAKDGKGSRNPVIIVNKKKGIAPISVTIKNGQSITLDASKSYDPDGDRLATKGDACQNLHFIWWKQGTKGMEVLGSGPTLTITEETIRDAQHPSVVCEVRSEGQFRLVSYRRVHIIY